MKNYDEINYFDIIGMAQKSYSKLLEPICRKWDLTKNELDVLLFLYNNPQFDRAADIVARRGIAKSHVSLSATNLEGRGLLERHLDPADRRMAHLVLMDEGRQIAHEAQSVQRGYFSQLYQGISEEEFLQWGEISRRVCDNIKRLSNNLTSI